MGGTIVADESYSEGDTDFSAQLTSIKAKNPDGIFVPGYYTEVGLIARQARKLGHQGAAAGRRRLGLPQAHRNRRRGAQRLLFLQPLFAWTIRAPSIQKFVADYKARYQIGQIPDALAGLGYDAALILFDAIKRANSTEAATACATPSPRRRTSRASPARSRWTRTATPSSPPSS